VTLRVDGGGNVGSWLSERGGYTMGSYVREHRSLESIIDYFLTGILYRQKTGVRTFPLIGPVVSVLSPRAG
jgi:hypothetical protein